MFLKTYVLNVDSHEVNYYISIMLQKQWFNQEPLPALADIILKVKQQEDLSPIEELVYLMGIEEIPLEEAVLIIEERWNVIR